MADYINLFFLELRSMADKLIRCYSVSWRTSPPLPRPVSLANYAGMLTFLNAGHLSGFPRPAYTEIYTERIEGKLNRAEAKFRVAHLIHQRS